MRFLDIIFSLLILIFLTPLFIILSIVLLFLNKRVFFNSERVGIYGKKFNLIKFSTIKTKSKIASREKFSYLGRFLRRSSLDEIPQLFNVLIGNMSLVGPRPLPYNVEKKIPKKYRVIRRTVLPGMTGKSQLNFKGKKRSLISKVKNDIEYINSKNLVNFFKIICITPFYILIKYKKNKSGFTL